MTVFQPNRKRNARGEQRLQELLKAAAAVFACSGYHETTTNAIAAEAGVSPATLYQFFPNKDAIASALATSYAREMVSAERAIDPNGVLSFDEAVTQLLNVCMAFNRKRPEFHTIVLYAQLSEAAREEKHALSAAFVDFIAARLQRACPSLSPAERKHHGEVALMIFRGILDELATAAPSIRTRLQQAMRDAVLRYLRPVADQESSPSPSPKIGSK